MVRLEVDRPIDLGSRVLEPAMQCRRDVVGAVGQRLEQFHATVVAGQRDGDHRAIALVGDALVPVVVGPRAEFARDEAQPRVLARRLVEVQEEARDPAHLVDPAKDHQGQGR